MQILICRGIGEALDSNMLNGVKVEGIKRINVRWPASYGTTMSYSDSIAEGKRLVRDHLSKDRSILVGYSGGADLAHLIAAEGHSNLAAVALLSTPHHPKSGPGAIRWGITDPLEVKLDPKRFKCWTDPRDPISQSHKDSPLRDFAKISSGFAAGDPSKWHRQLLEDMRSGKFQPLNPLWLRNPAARWRAYGIAADEVLGYLPPSSRIPGARGDHSSYHIRKLPNGKTYIQDMQAWVQSLVNA